MSLVQFEVIDHTIGKITLNRPEAANALSQAVLGQLQTIIDQIERSKTLRVIILTAHGEKAFCAGADLKERKMMNDDEVIEAVRFIHETVNRVEKIELPVIAAINGVAFGGGLEIALACDIRIMAKHATIGLTETALAIIPGAGGTQRLARLIGTGQAKHLIFRAARISAEEAFQRGIVEEIVAGNDIQETALTFAKQIAANGPLAIKLAKQAINQGIELSLHDGLQLETKLYNETIHTEDRKEGLVAFSEKRKPNYIGK